MHVVHINLNSANIESMDGKFKTAIFGGGCFWCTEAIFSQIKGVNKVTSGYAGGIATAPSYQQVCSGTTGHAEVIKVEYNPDIINYTDLLDIFFHTHDPTSLNRQGNDVGDQYRSIILYTDQSQKEAAEAYINKLNASGEFASPVVTVVKLFTEFYEAEDYHQGYYESNIHKPYCQMIISPKLDKLKQKFFSSLKAD